MELKFSRRVFLKSAAAAALAVSAAGLTACGSGDLVANAKGLNDTAELREIKMTVRSLSYGYASDGTFYLVPEVLINNGSAAGIPIDPANGSFKLRVNGSKDLTMDSGTMAFLKKNKSWNAMNAAQKQKVKAAAQAAAQFNNENRLKEEGQIVDFFKQQGLQVSTPDVDAFRKHVQEVYQGSEYAKTWPKGLVERINATK